MCVVIITLRCRHRPEIHSFPTRRSSDLILIAHNRMTSWLSTLSAMACRRYLAALSWFFAARYCRPRRSEEHTSEPQFHLVCRLLLEKKKRVSSAEFGVISTLGRPHSAED